MNTLDQSAPVAPATTDAQIDYDMSMAWLDPEVPIDQHKAAMQTIKGWFRDAGLSAEEAAMLVRRFNEAIDPYLPRDAKQRRRIDDAAIAFLRRKWGERFDDNMAAAKRAIERLGGVGLEGFLVRAGLRLDPFVLQTLVRVADREGW